MKGELNPQTIRIDYTKVAEPLETSDIQDDIQELQSRYLTPIDELVMWEHQLDWLAKPFAKKGKRSRYWAIDSDPPVKPQPPELFGIPVRLA